MNRSDLIERTTSRTESIKCRTKAHKQVNALIDPWFASLTLAALVKHFGVLYKILKECTKMLTLKNDFEIFLQIVLFTIETLMLQTNFIVI